MVRETLELASLDLEGLSLIDQGLVNVMFKHHLLRIARDCADRPGEVGPRQLTLTITAVPVMSQQGELDHVKSDIAMTSKLPNHRTKVYQMRFDKESGLLFNQSFPSEVDQRTLLPHEVDE